MYYRRAKCSGADPAKCGMVCVADLGVLPRYYSQTASLPLSLCASLSVALLLAQTCTLGLLVRHLAPLCAKQTNALLLLLLLLLLMLLLLLG